jgi:hypothetical protein
MIVAIQQFQSPYLQDVKANKILPLFEFIFILQHFDHSSAQQQFLVEHVQSRAAQNALRKLSGEQKQEAAFAGS